MDGIGSPRAAQKKLATPPTRTDWLIGRFVISGGSKMKKEYANFHVKKIVQYYELILTGTIITFQLLKLSI